MESGTERGKRQPAQNKSATKSWGRRHHRKKGVRILKQKKRPGCQRLQRCISEVSTLNENEQKMGRMVKKMPDAGNTVAGKGGQRKDP